MYLDRKRLHMSETEIDEFLSSNIWGRLATASASGEPHLTPVGYVHHDGAIYFYALRRSRRGRDLSRNDRATMLVDDGVAPGEDYSRRRGVIVYGRCSMLTADDPVPEEVRGKYTLAMGAASFDDLNRVTHTWYRLRVTRRVSWDFRRIPPGADYYADHHASRSRQEHVEGDDPG